MYKQSEAIKEIREVSESNGLIFKKCKNIKINDSAAYKFVDKETGNTVLSSMTLWAALDKCANGYIEKIMGNGPKPTIEVTVEEYEICGERNWVVKENGVNQGGPGFLDSDQLQSVVGAAKAKEIIENESKDWRWER